MTALGRIAAGVEIFNQTSNGVLQSDVAREYSWDDLSRLKFKVPLIPPRRFPIMSMLIL